MNNPRPATHVVTYSGHKQNGRFTTWCEKDAARYANAWVAVGFEVDVSVVEQPAVQAVLQAEVAS